jgi:hypothetical protein
VFIDNKIKYIASCNEDGTRKHFWTVEIAHLLDNIFNEKKDRKTISHI